MVYICQEENSKNLDSPETEIAAGEKGQAAE
jgi:hypothetical protein